MARARRHSGLPFWVTRSRSVGAPAWAPTDKSGLLFWFKADSGVTQSSNLVTQWDDQSGNARHATAAGAQRPTYTASILNSLPGISFPASTYMGFGTDVLFTSGSAFSLVMVFKNTSVGGTYYHVACLLNTPVTNRMFAVLASNDVNYADLNWAYVGANGAAAATIKATCDVTTAAASTFINYNGGTATSTGSWDAYVNNTALIEAAGSTSQAIGNFNRLGAWYDGSLNFIGSLYEVFAYSSVLTAGEQTSVDTYLSNKWAI